MELPILIAKAKAEALFHRIKEQNIMFASFPGLIITMDQVTLYKNSVREKPSDRSEAIEFLSSYSNESVSTLSAVCITHYPSGVQKTGIDVASVHWKAIPSATIRKVVDKGDIFSSAGGFRIEDEDLSVCIDHIEGTIDSVVGFPVELTEQLIGEVLEVYSPRGKALERGFSVEDSLQNAFDENEIAELIDLKLNRKN